MTNTEIIVIGLALVAVWIYYQYQQPSIASKGTQTELQTENKSTQTKEKEVKEAGVQYEYQPVYPKGTQESDFFQNLFNREWAETEERLVKNELRKLRRIGIKEEESKSKK